MTFLPLVALLAGLVAQQGQPAPDQLVRARESYNARRFDEAVALATSAREVPRLANAATVVLARSYLERYRDKPEPGDLTAAREALKTVDAAALEPRDHLEYLVGLGVSLYLEGQADNLEDRYGAAAEIFQTALAGAERLTPDATELLFDWWANALDRHAQYGREVDRKPVYARLLAGTEQWLERHDGSPAGLYWLAAASRGAGDLNRAHGAAISAWVRARDLGTAGVKLRADLDRLVTQVILPERAQYLAPDGDALQVLDAFKALWDRFKLDWGGLATGASRSPRP